MHRVFQGLELHVAIPVVCTSVKRDLLIWQTIPTNHTPLPWISAAVKGEGEAHVQGAPQQG